MTRVHVHVLVMFTMVIKQINVDNHFIAQVQLVFCTQVKAQMLTVI